MQHFDDWMRHTYDTHAADPAATAARLSEGNALLRDESQLGRLALMVHHTHGEHLGAWDDAAAALRVLQAHPLLTPGSPTARALDSYQASLAISSGAADAEATLARLPPEEQVRAQALAAVNLAARDASRASLLLKNALAAAEANGFADDADKRPHARTLASNSNNLACLLEEKALRSADERALMVLAAEAARRWWAVAGGWLEVARAEYRLAHSWLLAGDPQRARRHAQLCVEAAQVNAAPPLEHFFGWEALGLAERACGDLAAHERALAQARQAFGALSDEDRAFCQASLDKLQQARATPA